LTSFRTTAPACKLVATLITARIMNFFIVSTFRIGPG
jgi:hypothetical protein